MSRETPTDSPNNPTHSHTPMHDGQQTAEPEATVGAHKHDAHDRLLNSRGAVLSFLFLVAGVVGLPLLWVNPNFSRRERVFWTVIMLLYSFILLVLFGGMLWWIFQLIIGA